MMTHRRVIMIQQLSVVAGRRISNSAAGGRWSSCTTLSFISSSSPSNLLRLQNNATTTTTPTATMFRYQSTRPERNSNSVNSMNEVPDNSLNNDNSSLKSSSSSRDDTTRNKSKTTATTSTTSSSLWNNFVIALRWKAATALTASLPLEEREQLLQQLSTGSNNTISSDGQNNNKNNTEGKTVLEQAKPAAAAMDDGVTHVELQNSIAEAVAAARAQESQRHAEKWEREKDAIYQQAEQAALARVESDLLLQKRRLAFAQWQEQLSAQQQQQQQQQPEQLAAEADPASASTMETPSTAQVDTTTMTTTTEISQLQEDPQQQPMDTTTASQQQHQQPHPILGPCILDLGYKRLHVMSAQALTAIPVWKKQRIYRHDRAKSMALDKQKSMHLGMPGVIGLYEYHTTGQLAILDGQHRVGMFTILAANNNKKQQLSGETQGILDQIVVEVYPQRPEVVGGDGEAHAQELFLEINKAEPVKLIDMPGIAKTGDRNILNDAVDMLYEQYMDMFKASQNCRPPHVNRDNMRDALFAANVLHRHYIKSSTQLVEWMQHQNDVLCTKYSESDVTTLIASGVSPSALQKAHKYRFYLGIDSSWYYN